MGTGILATLLQLHGGSATGPLHLAAVVVLVLAWAVLLGLGGAFAVRVARRPGTLRATTTDPVVLPMWGTVAMGLLAVGSATVTVLPVAVPGAEALAVGVDAVLWTAGTVLGLATALGFSVVLLRGHPGPPTLVWGLPIVPPMVSATTGTAFAPYLGDGGRFLVVLVTSACFGLALVLGLLVFGIGYHHHWRVSPVALAASPSTWIPLGIVGQSAAAAQAIATAAAPVLAPDAASLAHDVAAGYGVVVLTIGLPLVAWAVVVTARGFLGRMPFTPGWWALTFPVGTLSLGAHLLGAATGSTVLTAVGAVVLAVLCGTWSLCATASLSAVAAARHPGAPTREASRTVRWARMGG
ncbi:C4-dicarboxylate ABC transporter [Phycicoccus sp. CMS6Z-2]|nr:C4-dicarboxylate ABC transporter [Phycicoccus flavus]